MTPSAQTQRFRPGQFVHLHPSPSVEAAAKGAYIVLTATPRSAAGWTYELKGSFLGDTRSAAEEDLRAMGV